MDILTQDIFLAGLRSHVELFGATVQFNQGLPVPCTASKPKKGWILANGKSPRNFVESIKIERGLIHDDFFQKGVSFKLIQSDATNVPILNLRWEEGGLTTDGLVWDFSAHDLNENA